MIEALTSLNQKAEQWHALLQQQNEALTSASSNELEQITAQVADQTAHLEKDVADMFAKYQPDFNQVDPQTAELWQALKNRLTECQKMVTVNGNVARLADASIARSIDLLTGNSNHTSYGKNGQITRNRKAIYNQSA